MVENSQNQWPGASNPIYIITSKTEEFSLGEVAAPVIAFGDIQHGTVNRSLVEYFFGIPPSWLWKMKHGAN